MINQIVLKGSCQNGIKKFGTTEVGNSVGVQEWLCIVGLRFTSMAGS